MDFENFFKNKTVLVTGHTGFKGAWLSIWLNNLGAKVIGYSLDPYYKESLFELTKLKEKIIDIRGDIKDFNKLESVFNLGNQSRQEVPEFQQRFEPSVFGLSVSDAGNVAAAVRWGGIYWLIGKWNLRGL